MAKNVRLLSFALAVIIVMSSLAGCGGTSAPEDSSQASTVQKSTADASASAGKSGPSWSWDTSPVTIDWFVNYDWAWNKWDAKNTLMCKMVTEKTGVTLNIITPTGGGDEKLNTMIAGGTLPDVVTLDWRAPQIKLMVNNGLLYSIDELVGQYSPTMDAIISKSLKQAHQFPDGKLYGMPSYFWAPEEMDPEKNYWETNAGMLARKDIMENLGIKPEDFATQEDTISALKKVKDANVKYKGVAVAPLYFGAGGLDALDLTIPAFFAVPMEDEQGNYIDMRTHPKYLEAVKFCNRLYREGLLSKENFTAQRQQIEEKITAGNVFAFIGNVGDYNGAMGLLHTNDPACQFTTVAPIRAQDGAEPVRIESGMGWTMSLVTKAAKHADRAIRFMEFLYSEEGDLIQYFGVEGDTYKKNADGTVEFLPELQKLNSENPEEFAKKYGFGAFGWLINYTRAQRRTKPADENAEIKTQWYKEMAKIVYPTTLFEKLEPNPDTEESNNLTQINDFWNKNVVKMMVADSEQQCEKIYNESIEQIKKMGLDAIDKVKNENFQKNKEAAGVKFAWPSYLK